MQMNNNETILHSIVFDLELKFSTKQMSLFISNRIDSYVLRAINDIK